MNMKSVLAGWTIVAALALTSSIAFGQKSQKEDSQPQQVAKLDASPASPQDSKAPMPKPAKHKVGPFDISINWRTRTEGWNWFEGNTGNSSYPFFDSLLRVGVGQTRERVDWFIEGESASILGLPNNAVAPAPLGQLGLGGTYYAANGNQ